MKYEKITYEDGLETIMRYDDNGISNSIPLNPSNSDYQAYLAWLENPQAALSTPMVIDDPKS